MIAEQIAPADTGQAAPAQTDALHTCPCFKHADARAAAGITPPPIVIGGYVFKALPCEGQAPAARAATA